MRNKITRFIFSIVILSISIGLHAQSYEEWIDCSFKYIDANQLDSAEIALQSALQVDPANPLNAFLLNNLGTIQQMQGKNEEALLSYSVALARYPDNEVFLSSRAALFAETGQFRNALVDYNNLLEKSPDNIEYLYQRGLLHLSIKDYSAAEKDFGRMLELYPDNVYARIGYASFYKITGNYNEAEKLYNRLIEMDLENPVLLAGRAELYLLMEKGSKAMSDINKAMSIVDKEDPYHYIIRSKAKALLYEKEDALKDIERAIELGYDPEEAKNIIQ